MGCLSLCGPACSRRLCVHSSPLLSKSRSGLARRSSPVTQFLVGSVFFFLLFLALGREVLGTSESGSESAHETSESESRRRRWLRVPLAGECASRVRDVAASLSSALGAMSSSSCARGYTSWVG